MHRKGYQYRRWRQVILLHTDYGTETTTPTAGHLIAHNCTTKTPIGLTRHSFADDERPRNNKRRPERDDLDPTLHAPGPPDPKP